MYPVGVIGTSRAPEEVDNTPALQNETRSSAHSVVSPHAPEEVDNTFNNPSCNGNVGSANVYLTTAGLARGSCVVQGNPQTSHDDGSNLPLSSQDEVDLPDGLSVKLDSKAQRAKPHRLTPDGVVSVNGLLHYETGSGLNTSGTYSTPEPPGKALRAESGALAIPARKPEATEPETIRLHRNDLRRSRDERSNAEISRPSLRSGGSLMRNFAEPAISPE